MRIILDVDDSTVNSPSGDYAPSAVLDDLKRNPKFWVDAASFVTVQLACGQILEER